MTTTLTVVSRAPTAPFKSLAVTTSVCDGVAISRFVAVSAPELASIANNPLGSPPGEQQYMI